MYDLSKVESNQRMGVYATVTSTDPADPGGLDLTEICFTIIHTTQIFCFILGWGGGGGLHVSLPLSMIQPSSSLLLNVFSYVGNVPPPLLEEPSFRCGCFLLFSK